jgi:hypothetical protein
MLSLVLLSLHLLESDKTRSNKWGNYLIEKASTNYFQTLILSRGMKHFALATSWQELTENLRSTRIKRVPNTVAARNPFLCMRMIHSKQHL